MARDIWLDDDQPGCLECGALVFKASRVSGVCALCMNEVSSIYDKSDYEVFYETSSSRHGDDIPWTETY
jgi:hypothetical protein